MKNMDRFLVDGLNRDEPLEVNIVEETEKYKDFVYGKLALEDSDIIPVRSENFEEIVHRSIDRQKPFKQGDKGFKDTLIWLCIREYCISIASKQVVFISRNHTDFALNSSENRLAKELEQECEELGIKVFYFKEIKEFIEKHSSKIEKYDAEWLESKLDIELLEKELEDFIRKDYDYRVLSILKKYGVDSIYERYTVESAHFHNVDGISIYEMVDSKLSLSVEMQFTVEFRVVQPPPYDYQTYLSTGALIHEDEPQIFNMSVDLTGELVFIIDNDEIFEWYFDQYY